MPDGTFENTGALGMRYSLVDRTGDGNYTGSWIETQFGLVNEQDRGRYRLGLGKIPSKSVRRALAIQ